MPASWLNWEKVRKNMVEPKKKRSLEVDILNESSPQIVPGSANFPKVQKIRPYEINAQHKSKKREIVIRIINVVKNI